MRGTVERIEADAGFGHIAGDDRQQYFFHRNATKSANWEQFAPGSRVVFDIDTDPGDNPGEDPRAVNVELTPDSPPAVDHELLPEEKVPDVGKA